LIAVEYKHTRRFKTQSLFCVKDKMIVTSDAVMDRFLFVKKIMSDRPYYCFYDQRIYEGKNKTALKR